MNGLAQAAAMIRLNLAQIPDRIGQTAVAVIGVAVTVGVMTAMLAIGAGLLSSAELNISPRQAVVLPAEGASDYLGSLPRETVPIVAAAGGIARSARGEPLVQPVAMVVVEVKRRSDGSPANISVRGSGPIGRLMDPAFKIVEGRDYRSGLRELLVGRSSRRAHVGLDVGDSVSLRGSRWQVVGEFEDGGSIKEGGLLGDVETVLQGFGRTAYQTIEVETTSEAAIAALGKTLAGDPRLAVKVKPLKEYVGEKFRGVTSIIDFVAYFVGVIMAIGATIGLTNTMYAAIDARRRDIATLRALGFRRSVMMFSLLVESLVLAVPSALLGVAAAWLLCSGARVTTRGFNVPLTVTGDVAAIGVVFAIAIGAIGGVAAAVRLIRLPLVSALRAA